MYYNIAITEWSWKSLVRFIKDSFWTRRLIRVEHRDNTYICMQCVYRGRRKKLKEKDSDWENRETTNGNIRNLRE